MLYVSFNAHTRLLLRPSTIEHPERHFRSREFLSLFTPLEPLRELPHWSYSPWPRAAGLSLLPASRIPTPGLFGLRDSPGSAATPGGWIFLDHRTTKPYGSCSGMRKSQVGGLRKRSRSSPSKLTSRGGLPRSGPIRAFLISQATSPLSPEATAPTHMEAPAACGSFTETVATPQPPGLPSHEGRKAHPWKTDVAMPMDDPGTDLPVHLTTQVSVQETDTVLISLQQPPAIAAAPSAPLWAVDTSPAQEHVDVLPSLHDICSATWQSVDYLPADVRRVWFPILSKCLNNLAECPTERNLTLLFLASKALLATPRRGGKARAEAVTRTFRARLHMWTQGQSGKLWTTVAKEHPRKAARHLTTSLDAQLRKVARLVDDGLLSKAAARLCSRGIAEPSDSLFQKVQRLFPTAAPPRCPPAVSAPFQATVDEVRKLVLTAPNGLAPGPSSLRFEHLRYFRGRKCVCDDSLVDALTRVVNCALAGDLAPELRPFLCGGRLVPLLKKDGGIRPLVVGERLRAVIAKVGVRLALSAAATLQPLQVGVGGAGPWIQAAVLTMRSWADELREDELILKIDLSNAYNSVDRTSCLMEVRERCPELLHWANWCLAGSSDVYFGHQVIDCQTGVQQGDPLAPLLFSMGLQGALESVEGTEGHNQVWYLDDGGLRGRASVVSAAFDALCGQLLARGLRVNTHKCEVYAFSCPQLHGALAEVPMELCFDKWSYLGAPIREQSMAALAGTLRRIEAVDEGIRQLAANYQCQALQPLRASSGACRVEFLL